MMTRTNVRTRIYYLHACKPTHKHMFTYIVSVQMCISLSYIHTTQTRNRFESANMSLHCLTFVPNKLFRKLFYFLSTKLTIACVIPFLKIYHHYHVIV